MGDHAPSPPWRVGSMSSNDEMKAIIGRVRDRLVVTKVVCTRSIKNKQGDTFVGFSAGWDTVQEDGGQGLIHAGDEAAESSSGMSLKESKIAAHILGMQTDMTAIDHALAGSLISSDAHERAARGIKHNYGQLMAKLLGS